VLLVFWLRSYLIQQQQQAEIVQKQAEIVQRKVNGYKIDAEAKVKRGEFRKAADTYDEAARFLGRDRMVDERRRLEADRDLLGRLADVTQSANDAWFYAGEERGGSTRVACEKALGYYGVLERSDWQTQPPVRELPRDQATPLRAEIHRLLLLRAALCIEDSISSLNRRRSGGATPSSAPALRVVARAQMLEATEGVAASQARAILEKGASGLVVLPLLLLEPWRSPSAAVKSFLPIDLTAEDGFFLGVMHVYLAKHQKDRLALAIKYMGPGEFDYAHPRDTAVMMLRQSVSLELGQYWPHFMLGRILAFPGPDGKANYPEACQAFTTCIVLRGDYSRGVRAAGPNPNTVQYELWSHHNLVPTLCVGMPSGPLRGRATAQQEGRRRASKTAFPRRAWELDCRP
jgi:hypothetical protein